MKKILKCASALALASTISLQATNVFAANTCAPGQTEHTDYYMFLNVGSADFYKENVTADKDLTYQTGAEKANQVKGKVVIDEGPVDIYKGSEHNTSGESKDKWTVDEYWRKYYNGMKNASGLIYNTGNESYIFHAKWDKYEHGFTGAATPMPVPDSAVGTRLISYIENNLSNLESSELVTSGTNLPGTILEPRSRLATATTETVYFQVSRLYTTKDALEGVTIEGFETKQLYSPGAYMIKYCVGNPDGSGSGEESTSPAKKYKVTYNGNGSDVSGIPNEQTYNENECFNVLQGNPKRSGYKFVGWSENSKATSPDKNYEIDKEICKLNKDITLYAVWKPEASIDTPTTPDTPAVNPDGTFTVTYDANGGKDAPAPQTGEKGKCITITDKKPTLANNNFLGWSKKKDAKEPDAEFAAGKEYCKDNITLYAVWQPKTGVSAHLIGFGLAAVAAGAALVIAKKKNLFKQI